MAIKGRGTPHSAKLQHYWNLTIRLFGVIFRTLVVGVLPLCINVVSIFSSPCRRGKKPREKGIWDERLSMLMSIINRHRKFFKALRYKRITQFRPEKREKNLYRMDFDVRADNKVKMNESEKRDLYLAKKQKKNKLSSSWFWRSSRQQSENEWKRKTRFIPCQKAKKNFHRVDFDVRADNKVKMNESENKDIYLAKKQTKMYNMYVTMMQVVLWTIPKNLVKIWLNEVSENESRLFK